MWKDLCGFQCFFFSGKRFRKVVWLPKVTDPWSSQTGHLQNTVTHQQNGWKSVNLAQPFSSTSVAAGWQSELPQAEKPTPAAGALEFTSPKLATQPEPEEEKNLKNTARVNSAFDCSSTPAFIITSTTDVSCSHLVASDSPRLKKGSKSLESSPSSEKQAAFPAAVSVPGAAGRSVAWLAAGFWDDCDPPNLQHNSGEFGGCADVNCCTRFPYCRVSDLLRDLACVANLISFSSQMSSSSSSSSKGWILSLEQASNAAVLACKSQADKFNERTSIFMMQRSISEDGACP